MRKYYSVFFILCSLLIYSNAQAQLSLGDIIAASQEAERERISEAPKLAPRLIPQARNQSRLGSYLIEQLTIQSEDPEANKRNARKIRTEIKKINRDLSKLDAGIFEWERENYKKRLDKLTATFSKHTRKYNNIVAAEQEKFAAAERAEQEKLAAAERAEQERLAAAEKAEQARLATLERAKQAKIEAYKTRCEGLAATDDPFASFNAAQEQEPRMDVLIENGSRRNRIKIEASNENCMWIGLNEDESYVPMLISEELFKQNPNNQSQYVLTIADNKVTTVTNTWINMLGELKLDDGASANLVIDFENYQCLFQKSGGTRQIVNCVTSRAQAQSPSSTPSKSFDPAGTACNVILRDFENNAVLAADKYGLLGSARMLECLTKI